jgi:hypothetical protein
MLSNFLYHFSVYYSKETPNYIILSLIQIKYLHLFRKIALLSGSKYTLGSLYIYSNLGLLIKRLRLADHEDVRAAIFGLPFIKGTLSSDIRVWPGGDM